MNGFKPTSIVVDGPVCIGNWCPHNYGHSYSGAVTLTQAITRSINVVPVKLSIAIGGKGGPKAGRAKIVEVGAPILGIKAPLPDTPSLPIGADEVTVIEHAVAYATFPDRAVGHAVMRRLRFAPAPAICLSRFDRDRPKRRNPIPAYGRLRHGRRGETMSWRAPAAPALAGTPTRRRRPAPAPTPIRDS